MGKSRMLGAWAIIAGILLNNLAYLIDIPKDGGGVVIILGTLSLAGILAGVVLVLFGMVLLLRSSAAPTSA